MVNFTVKKISLAKPMITTLSVLAVGASLNSFGMQPPTKRLRVETSTMHEHVQYIQEGIASTDLLPPLQAIVLRYVGNGNPIATIDLDDEQFKKAVLDRCKRLTRSEGILNITLEGNQALLLMTSGDYFRVSLPDGTFLNMQKGSIPFKDFYKDESFYFIHPSMISDEASNDVYATIIVDSRYNLPNQLSSDTHIVARSEISGSEFYKPGIARARRRVEVRLNLARALGFDKHKDKELEEKKD